MKFGLCGSDPEALPNVYCLKYLWKISGCKANAFDENRWKNITLLDAEKIMTEIHNNSLVNKINSNSESYRIMCFGKTSLNEKNIALYKSINLYGQYDTIISHGSHLTDGVRNSNLSYGSCSRITRWNSNALYITVYLAKYVYVRKAIFWPADVDGIVL